MIALVSGRNKGLTKLGTLALLLIPMVISACGGDNTPTPTTAPPQATNTSAPAGAASPTVAAGQPTATGAAAIDTPATTAGGGGNLRWSNEGISELDTLDPPRIQASNSNMAASMIFESLVRLDSKLNIQPAGAEKWDISPDGKTYTFTIRKGLKWADGTPVTSEDFRWSLERALSKDFANGSAGYYLSNIEGADTWIKGEGSGLSGVTAPDPNTLVIKIVKPGVYFLDELTYIGAAVVPRKLVDASPGQMG